MGKDLYGKEIGESVSQLASGRYIARVRNGKERISRTFDKKREALKWVADFNYDKEHGNINASSHMTLNAWFDYWLNEIKGNTIKRGTKNVYRNRYKSQIQNAIGKMLLMDIKPMHIQYVLNSSNKNGECYDSNKKLRSIMYSLFQSAVENELIVKNPVTSSVKALGDRTGEKIILNAEKQKEFVKVAQKYVAGDIFLFDLETGLRIGELLGLKWQDVDFENRTISVNRTLNFYNGRFNDDEPKTKSSYRTIPLTKKALQILENRKKQKLPIIVGYQDYIFRNSNGKPQHSAIYNRTLKAVGKQIGTEGLTLHSLRHTFATRCIESGMKPKTLQKILGHSSLNITMDLYVHVTFETEVEEMSNFETWTASGQ